MVAAGDFVRASDIPGDVRARLRRVANQSFTTAVQAALSWDTQDEDTADFWTSGGTITIPQDGFYAITGFAQWSSAPSTRSLIDIIPTSAIDGMPARFRSLSLPTTETTLWVAATIPLLESDTFTISPFYTGGTLTATGWVSVVKVGTL